MANKIQVRRGLKAELPVLSLGEPGYCTDTKEFFVGTGNGNVNMGGSHWYTGTEMSGTSTSSEYSYASCPDVKVGDMYLNTSYGYTYQCKTAGKGTEAKWQYKGSIRGAQGSYPTVDSSLSSSSVNPVQNKVINSALSGKAPTSHKSTATTYGLGDASSYGHLKLSDSTSSTSSTSSGIAATPKAVKSAYDLANTANESANQANNSMTDWLGSRRYINTDEIGSDMDNKLNVSDLNIRKNPNGGDIVSNLVVGTSNNISPGDYTFLSGYNNNAAGDYLGIIGVNNVQIKKKINTTTYGSTLFITGSGNNVEGCEYSIIAGYKNTAIGSRCCNAIGYCNTALSYQTKVGRHSADGISGATSGTSGDAFVVGIGTSSAKKNGFRVDYSGKGYFAVSVSGTGADVAELYEWQDGNTENEDRCGYFVIVEGDKVRIANSNDDITKPQVMRRIGVVSGNPGLVANNYADEWQGKYLRDVYNRLITEHKSYEAEYEDREVTNPETGETTVERVMIHDAYEADEYIVNPDYDDTQSYTPRHERPEWDYVSRHGQLPVNDDGTCVVNGYCKPNDNGVATSSDDGFYVMSRIDENHIMILI